MPAFKRKPRATSKALREAEAHATALAFDAVCALGPRKPPPGRPAFRMATTGELALAKEARLGLLGATGPFLDATESDHE